MPSRYIKLTVGVGFGIIVAGGIGYWFYKYLKYDPMPQKWRRVGTVKRINLFPLKSGAPVDVRPNDKFNCDVLGLRLHGIYDRILMLIDDNDKMVTARAYPKMVLIRSQLLNPLRIRFSAPNMPELIMDFLKLPREAPGKFAHTSIWGVKVRLMLCGKRFDEWFSKYLLDKDTGMKLVYYPNIIPMRETTSRLRVYPFIKQEDSGTLVDATSYMLMNHASINDLNKRLTRPVDILQFRGNFEINPDVDSPYEEDNWNWIRIGETAIFRVIAPCTRCIFPNINVLTGERDPDGEPFKTLRSYRLFNYSSPALGVHLGVRETGVIQLHDIVYVEDSPIKKSLWPF